MGLRVGGGIGGGYGPSGVGVGGEDVARPTALYVLNMLLRGAARKACS
jgi:hypothetical protein